MVRHEPTVELSRELTIKQLGNFVRVLSFRRPMLWHAPPNLPRPARELQRLAGAGGECVNPIWPHRDGLKWTQDGMPVALPSPGTAPGGSYGTLEGVCVC